MSSDPPPVPDDAPGSLDAFRVGRPRPPHRPKKVACPNCGSQLELQDERTRLAVCASCGSRVFVGLAEATVLGKSRQRDFGFQLQIGDAFRHKTLRYRVVARLAFIEDGEFHDPTLQYLLYHPTRGSLWLSEYRRHWDLSWPVHVMPLREPASLRKGDKVETADGREWMVRETGVYELAYVDGALPWVAEVGDTTSYVEMDGLEGRGDTYEAERSGDEVEFGRGQRLTAEQVRRATGQTGIADPTSRRLNIVRRSATYRFVCAVALVAALINAVLAFVFYFQGEKVLRDTFPAEELSQEAFSDPFPVAEDGNVLEIRLEAPLSNAWMSVDLALVRDADWLAAGPVSSLALTSGGAGFGPGGAGGTEGAGGAGEIEVLYADDHDIEYYHGVEGGESWSEGDQDTTTFLRVPQAGAYRLLVRAVSAHGNAASATTAQHSLHVTVWDGARRALWPFLAFLASVGVAVWQAAALHKLTSEEE